MTIDKEKLKRLKERCVRIELMRRNGWAGNPVFEESDVRALIAEIEHLQDLVAEWRRSSPVLPSRACAAIIDQLKAENEALREEIAIGDKLVAERDRLLNLFGCPEHGKCVPYAMEQVEALRKDAERYRWLMSGAVYNGTLGIADGWIDFEFKDEAQKAIDASMAKEASHG